MRREPPRWPICRPAFALLVVVAGARADEPREVRGRVVDAEGVPVAGVDVDCFWKANGTGRDPEGKPLDLRREENVKAFWGHLGQMEPASYDPREGPQFATTDRDGRFALEVRDPYDTLMAIDRARRRGGIVRLFRGGGEAEVEIRLAPLVRVRGAFEGPGEGQRPHWTAVYVNVPDEPTHPLDTTRLVLCGSFEAKFEVWLPPGTYQLHAYSQFADKEDFEGEFIPDREIDLKGDDLDVDLGLFRFSPHSFRARAVIDEAKAAGTWDDYTEHYGEKAPRWHVTDARGVGKEVQPSDFLGKWLLVDFWGFSCRSCLKSGLPNLTRFYEEHADQRDRFEIVSICIDPEGGLKTMADVDRKLGPIVEHVWGGKPLPFPVLLDPSMETWERFGIDGLGRVLLIDPDGNLVPGDETTLAERLKRPEG